MVEVESRPADGAGMGVASFVGDAWDEAFVAFHARFAPYFGRREVRERSAGYLRGLLGPVERKNGWQLAEAIGERDPVGIQRLLYEAAWDADAVQDELERFVAEHLGDPAAVWAIDESGFVKKGTKSVGVQRQYSGTTGQVENCQIGVFLAYVAAGGYAFLDRRLYLPEAWAQDADRRQEAEVPDDVGFQTKPELAWAMMQRTWALGVPGRWVTGDTVYGQDPTFRAHLEARAPACYYVLAVPVSTVVYTEVTATVRAALAPPTVAAAGTPFARFARRAYTVYQEQTVVTLVTGQVAAAWQRLTVAAGAKGPRTYDWVAVRALLQLERPDGAPDPAPQARWVLARRSVSDPTDVAYYLSNAPADTPLLTLAQVAAARWPIEQCFEEAKGETGLDHYEVRLWTSWHRHLTLSLLAHTFLLHLRRQATLEVGGKGGSGRAPGLPVAPAHAGLAGAAGRSPAPAARGGPTGLATPTAAGPRGATFAQRRLDPADRPRGAPAVGSHLAAPSPLRCSALGLVGVAAPPPGDCPSLPLPPPSGLPATRPADLRL